jgi:hypothetical protein
MNPFTSSPRKHLLFALACLALVLFACRFPAFQPGSSVNTNDILPEPSVGLDGLQSYHAVYDQTIQGNLDGKSLNRHARIEYSFVTRSNDEEVLWQDQQTGSSEIFLHSLRLGSSEYSLSQDGQDCLGEYNDQPVEAVPQPVSLLLPVTQASQVGAEMVNGVASLHYHFDQNGLSSGGKGTSGEVWIAQQGGYVVKYTLSIPGPTNPTGNGAEVEEILSYELTEINSIDQIELPVGCTPVLVDIPAMTDAQNLYRSSGIMEYTTPSEIAQVINFYNQALPALGWTLVGPSLSPVDFDSQTMNYTKGDQDLTIILDKTGGGLEVTAVLFIPAQAFQEPTATPGPSPTPGIKPTADASKSGLPADVPLYPGATDLQALPTWASFSTSDSPDAVGAFYHDQLQTFGWNLQNEVKLNVSTVDQTWLMSKRILAIFIQTNNGSTTVRLMLSNQP